MLAKLLSSIMAEDLTFLMELQQLIPDTHFGGCPGCSTTDSLHLLVDMIKASWRHKQVVSILFLDIEGAFPNAVMACLLHNLRKRRVLEVYISFVDNLLTSCWTRLKFDNFTLSWFDLDNGIGQGDSLLMLLYLYYNADVLEVPKGRDELGLSYVDNMALLAVAKDFRRAHKRLNQMMNRSGGAIEWSGAHNSCFEATKSILVDFTHLKTKPCPPMKLQGVTLVPQPSNKFLGVLLDQELRWSHQASSTIAKASKWVTAFRRLAQPSTGICPRV